MARAIWERYKAEFPQDYEKDVSLGPNPYNFVYKIQVLVLGSQPNTGYDKQQVEAIKKLKQLQIRDWKYIKPFLQGFMYYSSVAGCYYDKSIGEIIP